MEISLCSLCGSLFAELNLLMSRTIAELYNETYTVIEEDWAGSQGLLQVYNRPRYLYTGGVPGLNASDLVILTYSGNR